MSLIGEPVAVWAEQAERCASEDIVDIADQIGLIDPKPTDIIEAVSKVVENRIHEGTMSPQLADEFYRTTAR